MAPVPMLHGGRQSRIRARFPMAKAGRRLMVCYRELGEPAEALNVYRRCREMLSIVLGVKPSPETEAIRATLG